MRIVALFVVVLLLQSCSKNAPIEGKWRLSLMDYSNYISTMEPEEAEMFTSMIQQHVEMITNRTFFVFKPEQKLTILSPKMEGGIATENGKWELNESGDSLYMNTLEAERFHIRWKHDDTLELNTEDRPQRTLILVREKN